jgi:two-component system LytT family sensor kinase
VQVILKPLTASTLDRVTKSRLAPLWFALCLWSGLVILFSFTAAVVNSEPWSVSLAHTCSFWLLWFFFLPLIVWLSLRFPLERPNVLLQAGFHLVACALVVIISQAAYRTFLPLPPPPPAMASASQNFPRANISPGFRAGPDIVIYLLIMSGCVAFAHFRKSQEKERRAGELEAHLAQAKLQALRMQINPHFLFNTLNAISTLVHTSPHTADEMITDLGELFRFSLESSNDQEIPLSRELELLRRYLAIEQRRFGQRLEIEQNADPEIHDALVPPLILQPIVENAIRHGIETQAGLGRIAISARRNGNQVKLSVSDNGKKPFDASIKEDKRQGIGLANTRARLQQLYGKEQSFSIFNGDLGGWTVEIKIPFSATPVTKSVL